MKYHAYNALDTNRINYFFYLSAIVNAVVIISYSLLFQLAVETYFGKDVTYVLLVLTLLVIIGIDSALSTFLLKRIRGKITNTFYFNLGSIISLVFAFVILTIYAINKLSNIDQFSFTSAENSIVISSLILTFFGHLVSSKPEKNAFSRLTNNNALIRFTKNEYLLQIVLILGFAILNDYLALATINNIIVILIIIIASSIISLLINISFSNEVSMLFNTDNNNREDRRLTERLTIEENPYKYEENLVESFLSFDDTEASNFIFYCKNRNTINLLPQLNTLLEQELPNYIKEELREVINYLEDQQKKYLSVTNYYEFVEVSSDYNLLKFIARYQIINLDKNLLIKLLKNNTLEVKREAIFAVGYHEDINFISMLIEYLNDSELSVFAQKSLVNIGEKALKYLEIEFNKRRKDIFFVESCFEVIATINSSKSNQILFSALNNVNKNIQLIALKKILNSGRLPSDDKRGYFVQIFEDLILNHISNYHLYEFLDKKSQTFYLLKNALKRENTEILKLLKSILSLYYPSGIIQGIFYYFEQNSNYNYLIANLLIDKAFQGNLIVYSKLKALVTPNDNRLLELLQEEFPHYNLKSHFKSEEDVIRSILNRNYDRLNQWTKACAIDAIQYLYSDDIPYDLAAEFLNEDELMQESAAISIFKNQTEFYTIFLNRLEKDEAAKLDYKIRSNLEYSFDSIIREDNLLLFNKIQFISSIPLLKSLSIYDVITFESYFKPRIIKSGTNTISLSDEENLGFWIVESDEIEYSTDGQNFLKMPKRSILDINRYGNEFSNVFIRTSQDVRLLFIEKSIIFRIIPDTEKIILSHHEEISEFSSNLQVGDNQITKVA